VCDVSETEKRWNEFQTLVYGTSSVFLHMLITWKDHTKLVMFIISSGKQLVCLTAPSQMDTITFTSHWIGFQQLWHPFSHLLMLAKGPTQGHNQYGQVGSCLRCENLHETGETFTQQETAPFIMCVHLLCMLFVFDFENEVLFI